MFDRYIGIDYSGAQTSVTRLGGLAVCCVVGDAQPQIVPSLEDGYDISTRDGLARWLVQRLREPSVRTLVGIDHGFSFPMQYFERYPHLLPLCWAGFLDDFQWYWPADDPCKVMSRLIARNRILPGREDPERRWGNRAWFRLTDPRRAASVFDFDAIQRNVAQSTHAGLPWLRHIRQALHAEPVNVRFWPFDRWEAPDNQSAVVEVYPALWNSMYRQDSDRLGLNSHQRDAYSVARWMSETDRSGALGQYFGPNLDDGQQTQAQREGWIFGVMHPTLRG